MDAGVRFKVLDHRIVEALTPGGVDHQSVVVGGAVRLGGRTSFSLLIAAHKQGKCQSAGSCKSKNPFHG